MKQSQLGSKGKLSTLILFVKCLVVKFLYSPSKLTCIIDKRREHYWRPQDAN